MRVRCGTYCLPEIKHGHPQIHWSVKSWPVKSCSFPCPWNSGGYYTSFTFPTSLKGKERKGKERKGKERKGRRREEVRQRRGKDEGRRRKGRRKKENTRKGKKKGTSFKKPLKTLKVSRIDRALQQVIETTVKPIWKVRKQHLESWSVPALDVCLSVLVISEIQYGCSASVWNYLETTLKPYKALHGE